MAQNKSYESPEKLAVRRLGLVLYVIYMCCLVYFLFFADWYDHVPGSHWEYHYNFVPFREIGRFARHWRQLGLSSVFMNLVGNIIGFVPFGFFLPVITGKLRSFWKAAGLGCLVSVTVELVQLVSRTGSCDIDDVILNTLGAALGYGLFLILDAVRRKINVP